MNYDALSELASDRMIGYVDRLASLEGDRVTQAILLAEIQDLAHVMDSDDEEVLAMTYHRELSESYGLVFEHEHQDPELMFGSERI